jgi:CheY-like chemotaxis protein
MDILILEDCSNRCVHFKRALIGHNVTITEHSKEAIEILSKSKFDILFLDHDLGGMQMVASGENTGYEVAEWLRHNPGRKPGKIFLHSLNTPGRKNMLRVLPEAKEAPFAWLNIKS